MELLQPCRLRNGKTAWGTALTSYAAETGSWDDVVSAFVDNWAMEKALTE